MTSGESTAAKQSTKPEPGAFYPSPQIKTNMTFVKESDHKYPASGACNNDSQPSNFPLDLLSDAQLTLEAVVDPDFAKPKDPTKVDPPEISGRPSYI